MYLNESLQICLLAVQSRYPQHTIDLDKEIVALQNIEMQDWTAQELLTLFSENAPELLQAPAHLNIDECNCEMYLPTRSKEKPAMYIHCRGKIPDHHARETKSMMHS